MKKSGVFITLSIIICLHSLAQEIQWASDVSFQFNHFSDTEYNASNALGAPDAIPYGQLSQKAFRLNAESGYGTMTLTYDRAQQVSQVLIVENYLPGRVSKVILYDTDENAHIIYESKGKPSTKTYDVLSIKVDKTRYMVQKVAVHLNTYVHKGWAQIDAVGISETTFEGEVIPGASAPAASNVAEAEEEIVFLATKERLSDNINTKYLESKPVISPDGTILYFARKNAPENLGGKRDDQDIYISDLVGKEWTYAHNIGKPLNDKQANGICSVSPDGNSIMVINAYHDDGTIEDGVSVSRKTASGWSFPKKQDIEDYHNLSEYQDYFQSNSGKVLISAVQRNDSKGDQDLYASFRTGDDSWSKPVNLGSTINTRKVEFAPFLASDNKTLYFASNGHRGFGESDIFYSRRLDDTWTNWSTPTNLGKAINSISWDGYYTISAKGDFAYFISTAGALNKVDFNPTDEDIYRISLSKEAKPDPVVLIKGKVINSKTKKPVEADIFYESYPLKDEEGLAISDPTNGNYKIVLPAGKKYGFRAEAKGFIAVSQNEDFTMVSDYKEITRDLILTPLAVGETVQLNNIFFEQSKAEMLPESKPELDRLLMLLSDNPSLEIELGGHTDNQGSSTANLRLSEDRAMAIMTYLIEQGIDKKRLESKGYGGTKPIASNASADSRQMNRRVEIKILKF
ncbi:MAG: OmpA family protein [Cyclobacteriaceae bacterium]|nr:OmpA family protein [Cyclobacteriaceae bacterium]